jgi:hypothetical protein
MLRLMVLVKALPQPNRHRSLGAHLNVVLGKQSKDDEQSKICDTTHSGPEVD